MTIKLSGQKPAEQNAFVSLIGDMHPDFSALAFGTYDLYNGMSFGVRAVRDAHHKYVWNPQAIDELYELESDPHELTNRIGDEALHDECDRLRRELFQWMDAIGDDLPKRVESLPPAGTILAQG